MSVNVGVGVAVPVFVPPEVSVYDDVGALVKLHVPVKVYVGVGVGVTDDVVTIL